MRWSTGTGLFVADRVPRYVIGFAIALLIGLIGEITVYTASGTEFVTSGQFLVGVVTTVPAIGGIAYGGQWLRNADFSADRYSRVVRWVVGGLVVFLLINLALIATMPPESWAEVVSWIRWAVVLGAATGLLIGCLEGKAIERTLEAERASLRATHLEEQREYLDYLNSILRHEVLNTATVVNGYASLLYEEASTDQQRRWAEIVIDESEEMSTVIDDVRILLRSVDGEWRLEPVDASQVLTNEVRKLEHKSGPIDVETSIPDDVFVRADELLARVFGNLLSNAVEHNDAETPRIEITVEPGPETVRFEIADNGPGIPDAKLESLFDRTESHGSTHGLGLYLVHQLVSRYGGSVELVDTGPEGSRFAVELPAASSARHDAEDAPTTALVLL
ncbi:sensor histidine kinase [Natrinema sp. 74]|uniref:sensor histidine kinase n=1 Tax=Natrinema sp. 74 TaxID=3384159 RepID=UPI0038D38BAC